MIVLAVIGGFCILYIASKGLLLLAKSLHRKKTGVFLSFVEFISSWLSLILGLFCFPVSIVCDLIIGKLHHFTAMDYALKIKVAYFLGATDLYLLKNSNAERWSYVRSHYPGDPEDGEDLDWFDPKYDMAPYSDLTPMHYDVWRDVTLRYSGLTDDDLEGVRIEED